MSDRWEEEVRALGARPARPDHQCDICGEFSDSRYKVELPTSDGCQWLCYRCGHHLAKLMLSLRAFFGKCNDRD